MKNSQNIQKNTLSDNSHFILYNTSNYKEVMMKNKTYYLFIFERGLETLIHVFSVIFYYTKNLELTFYHTQKAYYFYIEFIEQISDDNVTFLQLSSRDAILFVYKKTIFDLNNEYKKNIQEPTQEEKTILEIFNSYTYIYKGIILFIINHSDFNYENKTEYINICCDSIQFISETLNKNKIKQNYIDCVYLFASLLNDKKLEILDFFKLLDEFVKKIISKKKFDEKLIKNKIYDSEINNFINNNETNKIVEWIFSD